MNIFILDTDPYLAAKYQCDKHVNKMILESAQMLSTAHRVLDGTMEIRPSSTGKTSQKYWNLDDERENSLYNASQVNHPCNIWVRESCSNYFWLFDHFANLVWVKAYRTGKWHQTGYLGDILQNPPKNIEDKELTPFAIAINEEEYPNCIVPGDVVQSYRNYYIAKKDRMEMKWSSADGVPEWFK